MSFNRNAWAAHGSTSLFVLLWSGGAIFAKWGLAHASAFGFLLLRFVLALTVLLAICAGRRRWLPAPGTRQRGADGLPAHRLLFHLLSAGAGPRRHARVLATLLGAQPS